MSALEAVKPVREGVLTRIGDVGRRCGGLGIAGFTTAGEAGTGSADSFLWVCRCNNRWVRLDGRRRPWVLWLDTQLVDPLAMPFGVVVADVLGGHRWECR